MANPFWKPAVAFPLLFAGCYEYVPSDHAALPVATPVSIELSSRGTANVESKIGSNVTTIQGTVSDAAPGSLTIALSAVKRRGETAMSTWNGEAITLGSDDIDEVKTRRLSRGRTAVASAALAAASVGIVVGIAKATGTAEGNVGGKPSPNP